jgi:hypothetical protein
MDPLAITLIVIATFCAFCVLGLAVAVARAEEGYQDETGFHQVARPRAGLTEHRAMASPFEALPARRDHR